jgi:uncharacterized protein
MVIDAHHHLWQPWEEYMDRLLEHSEKLGIDRVVVTGWPPWEVGNDTMAKAQAKHPDFLLTMGFIRLGEDTPREVDRCKDLGLKGLKVILPLDRYDADEYMPIYARAAALNMPILFHLGIVARQVAFDQALDVSMARMRPVYLDRIARKFPELNILGAHLGNPWYDEAGELARMHPNVYFDITGSTFKKKSPEYVSEVFWWARNEQYGMMGDKHPYQKILFGTDVDPEMMEDVKNDYQQFMDHVGMAQEHRDMIWGGTAAQIFGLEE